MIETTLNANLSVVELNSTVGVMAKEMVEGFDMVYDRIDEKIAEVNDRLDKVETRLDNKIDGLRVEMNKRFEAVDKRFDRVETDMDLIKKNLLAMSGGISRIEKHLGTKDATITP
jgi:tetrahydromethanopterin S-methyltransferase subunit G